MSRKVEVVWKDNTTELFECDSFRVEGNFIHLYLDPEIDGGEKKLRTIVAIDLVKRLTAKKQQR